MTETEESELRGKTKDWLIEHFPHRKYVLGPLVFHGLDGTLREYLHSEFYGKMLSLIPGRDRLEIRPDVVALVEVTDAKSRLFWITVECKCGHVSVADLRQAVSYANIAKAYQGLLVFEGSLSREVRAGLRAMAHIFVGTNRWGREVEKKLQIVEFRDGRFATLLA